MKPFLLNSRLLGRRFGRSAVLLAIATGGLCGCSSFRTEWGKPLATEHAALAEDHARVAEVLRELGPPAKVSALPDGSVFLYEHTVISEFQFGLSIDYSLLRYIKFLRAWNWIERENLVLMFDDEGVLRSLGYDHRRQRLSGGGAVQLIFSAISLTDPALRRQQTEQLRWGRSCLEPLPVALNVGQSLRSGEHGLQLSFPPKYAGQQSLEMAKPVKPRKRKTPGLATPR